MGFERVIRFINMFAGPTFEFLFLYHISSLFILRITLLRPLISVVLFLLIMVVMDHIFRSADLCMIPNQLKVSGADRGKRGR